MKKTGLFTAIGLIVAALALRAWIEGDEISAGKISPTPPPAAGAGPQRNAAADFELETSQGGKIRLSDSKGKPVVVHFWAKWCPPCVHELPEFLALMRRMEGTDLTAIAISLDPNWTDAHQIVDESKLPKNVRVVLDPKSKTADAWGSYQFPETYLIDRRQRVAAKWVGPQDWSGDAMKAAFSAVLDEAP